MQSRTVAAAILLVLLGSVVAVQLADPQLGEQSPPDVDFSDQPSEIAADAATQFEYIDYSYRIDFRRNRTDDWRQVRTMQVDHTDREYYKTGPNGEDGVVLYGTDAVTFVRPGPSYPWRVASRRDVIYDPDGTSQPFIIERIRNGSGTIATQNQSILVIQLSVHPLNVAEHLSGKATLFIDRESGLIQIANVQYETKNSGTLYLRFTLTKSGTNVQRPADIPISPREVFWDALRGPICWLEY